MRSHASRKKYPIAMKTLDGELLKIFPNMTVASKETGILLSCISNCCLGMSKHAGGYVWEKIMNQEDINNAETCATI